MSGYTGNPDAESEQALILAENGIHAARQMLEGRVFKFCLECGEQINPQRVEALTRAKMKCVYCIECQENHNSAPKVKMLDWVL